MGKGGLRSACLRVDLVEMGGCCGKTRTGDEDWGRIAEECYGKRMLSHWARSGFGGGGGFDGSTYKNINIKKLTINIKI